MFRNKEPDAVREDRMRLLDNMTWEMVIILCLTLGLAPFFPPHVYEKLRMLFRGELVRPIDWFDLVLHGTPWVLLLLKLIVGSKGR
jgi:hypothetical protein